LFPARAGAGAGKVAAGSRLVAAGLFAVAGAPFWLEVTARLGLGWGVFR
jgi:hypothetical protein